MLFWSRFSRIWTEYGDLKSKHPYSVQMRENTDQKNTEYGHFSRNVFFVLFLELKIIKAVIARSLYKYFVLQSKTFEY